jgi:hypothetical protein
VLALLLLPGRSILAALILSGYSVYCDVSAQKTSELSKGAPMDDVNPTLLDVALAVAQLASAALHPTDQLSPTGPALLRSLLREQMGAGQKALPSAEIVKQLLINEPTVPELCHIHACFTQIYAWFKRYYDDAWVDAPSRQQQPIYDEFTAGLNELLAPDAPFLSNLDLLKQPEYIVPGFSAFLFGASLHLVMLKIDFLLKTGHQHAIDRPTLNILINHAIASIEQANQSFSTIQRLVADRVALVTQVKPMFTRYTFRDAGQPIDTGWETLPPFFPALPYADASAAQTARETYLKWLRARLHQQYYQGGPEKAMHVIAAWINMRDEYLAYSMERRYQHCRISVQHREFD